MSVQALSCAFALRGLSASEKLVLLALANFANEKMQCWPSQERIAADTELSPRTVWAALRGLEDKDIVQRTSRKRADGTRTTDVFTLHFALVVWSEPVADFANSTRKSCEDQSQSLPNPVAAVATLTTFDPSVEEPSEDEPVSVALSAPRANRPSKRVPETWTPKTTTLAALADEGFTPGDLERALTRMRDHEFRTPRSDWDAALRNWIRNDADRKPRPAHERPHTDAKLAAKHANLARAWEGSERALGRDWKP